VRGIEARRSDTPPFIVEMQMQILGLLAQEKAGKPSNDCLQQALALVRRKLKALRSRRIPLEALVIKQRLSRELENYRQPSPPARAAIQLEATGRSLRAGQYVRFVYTLGKPGVQAWDLPGSINPAMIDIARYSKLLLRAAHAVLEPFGYAEDSLAGLVGEIPARQLPLPFPRRSIHWTFN